MRRGRTRDHQVGHVMCICSSDGPALLLLARSHRGKERVDDLSCMEGSMAVPQVSGVRREESRFQPGSAAGWMVEAPSGKRVRASLG